ncbi:MAG: hypothetical protein HKN61_09980, partial [Flavobacteriaceae bacterium]|nr:hypothetical protein [Flavobacteriaceae bacterium]
AQGYDTDLSGYVSKMGHHYGKTGLIDETFELEKPEVLLYVPDGDEGMKFVAVEYLVTVPDPLNPPPPPEGFTGPEDVWFFNTDIGMWTLHVWVAMENSNGIFAAQNPALPYFNELLILFYVMPGPLSPAFLFCFPDLNKVQGI